MFDVYQSPDRSGRRRFLRVGTLGLVGLTLPGLLRARAALRGGSVKETAKNATDKVADLIENVVGEFRHRPTPSPGRA